MTRSAPASSARRPEGPPAALLAVLACAMGVGPLLNYGISAAGALLVSHLGIADAQLGLAAAVVFAAAAVSSRALGRLSDRVSVRAQLVLIFGGTAVALAVASFADAFWVLLLAAALAGLAQAVSNPTTNKVITQVVPSARRAGWVGVKQSGVQASQLFAGLYFPAVSLWLGWRGAALGAAALALVLLAFSLQQLPPELRVPPGPAASPDAGPHPAPAGAEDAPEPAADAAPARGRQAVWLLTAVMFLVGLGTQATNVYLPLYAVRELGFPLLLGGVAAGLAGVIGVASRIAWGRRMAAGATASALLVAITLGSLLAVACLFTAGEFAAAGLLWAGVALHGATTLGASVVSYAAVMALVPHGRMGAATGTVSMGMYAGYAGGPLAMGLLVGATGTFAAGWIAVAAAYVVAAGAALLLGRTARAGNRAASRSSGRAAAGR
ncbi:hypothetical protein NCCP1664_04880 [Zafaria cholistanensis]|uniref:Major facilitator superfamily (MFS) profile domain-containing protein n=1 Tax=Zafaria cholistanensis TaxID=1682741 RepID=A0A5A7NQC0_9MICC|nr:MFS transporter [Zafaria cholistanensis]GER21991.1 hypothetical protein NCCP1664_04880 [Zafaria cholistanensis]